MDKAFAKWLTLPLFLLLTLGLLLASCGEDVSPVSTLVTPTPSPTATPIPTATGAPLEPTPTHQALSMKQEIANAIQADSYTVTYCFILDKLPAITVSGQTVEVTMDDSQVSDSIDVERAKECIFGMERDTWSTNSSFTLVTAHVQVLLQDQYGKQSVGDLAYAWLERVTEQKFVWSNLDADRAWAAYDSTYLLPSS